MKIVPCLTEKTGVAAAVPVLPAGHRMKPRLKIGHLIILFVLAALPFAATFALYYPDERHYTDGALVMMRHGDWLVPKTAEGMPRFQKPPLAYWSVAASYEMFGVGVLASRLPFLLASCGTLWLTYRVTQRLTGNADTARLAAAVLLSHPQFFLCSVRSMPDALLVFFVTLSAYGFLRLMVFEELTMGVFATAYGGAAGMTLSKGLLGVAMVLFAWAFAFWQKRDWGAVKKIMHWPSLAAAILFAGCWFGYIFWDRGAEALNVFFDDQVTGNLHRHWWLVIGRAPLFLLILVFNFLPWSVTIVEWFARKKSRAVSNVPPRAQEFILVWTVLMIVGFAFGANVSLRYLLPATPLLSVLLADWWQGAERARLIFSLRRLLTIVLSALVLAVAMAAYIDSQWPLPPGWVVVVCGLFLSGIAILGLRALCSSSVSAGGALGLATLLGWMIFFTAAMPILLPDRAQQIATTLRQVQTDSARGVVLIGDVKLGSRLRVLLGKTWTVAQARRLNPASAADYTRVLVSEGEVGEFVKHGWIIQTAAVSFGRPTSGELWEALKSRRLPEMLARHAQRIYLVTR